MDKLSSLLAERLYRGVLHPVIVKAKPGVARELWAEVKQYELSRFADVTKALFRGVGTYPYYTGLIESFDMLSGLFARLDIEYLANHPLVERVYPDVMVYTYQSFPIVPDKGVYRLRRPPMLFTTTYWTAKALGANRCWKRGFTGSGVKVAVPDTGVSVYHEQLGPRQLRYKYYSVFKFNRADANGHGTWCCTAIGGRPSVDELLSRELRRAVAATGLAPGVRLYCIKVIDYVLGFGGSSYIIKGLEIARRERVNIVSLSIGTSEKAKRPEDDPFYHPIRRLYSDGVIVVAAAGNEGPGEGTIASPGALPYTLSVGAYDPINGSIARFSSRGPTPWGDVKPDVVAPGVNILSGANGILDVAVDRRVDRYGILSGTSMATPHASAVIALAYQVYRDKLGKVLTLDEIKRMMEAHAREKGITKNNDYGWGPITCDVFEWWLQVEYGAEL